VQVGRGHQGEAFALFTAIALIAAGQSVCASDVPDDLKVPARERVSFMRVLGASRSILCVTGTMESLRWAVASAEGGVV